MNKKLLKPRYLPWDIVIISRYEEIVLTKIILSRFDWRNREYFLTTGDWKNTWYIESLIKEYRDSAI